MSKNTDSLAAPIEIDPPFLSRFQCGNTGIDYLHSIDSGKPGPHVMITSVVHGNEFSGGIAVAELIDNPPDLLHGRLSLCFVNAEACSRFDRDQPWHSRFVDEDMNRIWTDEVLSGSRQSLELNRAREMRSVIDSVDYLLDLHSMAVDAPAVVLAGSTEKGHRLAEKLDLGLPIILDEGHQTGRRLRDYGEFNLEESSKTALLIECGQHWRAASVHMARRVAGVFLSALGMTDRKSDEMPPRTSALTIQVTETITANSNAFSFLDQYIGLERIRNAGTLIARDDMLEIVTPYDDCILVMPTHGVQAGQTAVRLGRKI